MNNKMITSISVTDLPDINCRLCNRAGGLSEILGFSALKRVSSDCKPQNAGGRLVYCNFCSAVQKPADQIWLNEIEKIYREYDIYHQSAGVEASVFTESAASSTRSTKLATFVDSFLSESKSGTLLDVGCGNGAFLRAINKVKPTWSLVGNELHDAYRDIVEKIPSLLKMYTCSPKDIPGIFDFISFIHVFEHLADPYAMLDEVKNKLSDEGVLLVEVPDYTTNPFDLIIADHATHFTPDTLSYLISNSGLSVASVSNLFIPKEITLLACKKLKSSQAMNSITKSEKNNLDSLLYSLNWLISFADKCREIKSSNKCGVFGTSNAGVWIYNSLEADVDFFVDEDLARQSRTLFNKPIYSPQDVPVGSHVLIALSPIQSTAVSARMSEINPGVIWHNPPAY